MGNEFESHPQNKILEAFTFFFLISDNQPRYFDMEVSSGIAIGEHMVLLLLAFILE